MVRRQVRGLVHDQERQVRSAGVCNQLQNIIAIWQGHGVNGQFACGKSVLPGATVAKVDRSHAFATDRIKDEGHRSVCGQVNNDAGGAADDGVWPKLNCQRGG